MKYELNFLRISFYCFIVVDRIEASHLFYASTLEMKGKSILVDLLID